MKRIKPIVFVVLGFSLALGGLAIAGLSATTVSTGQVIEASHHNSLLSDLIAGKFFNGSGTGSSYIQAAHDGTNGNLSTNAGDIIYNVPSGEEHAFKVNSVTSAMIGAAAVSFSFPVHVTATGNSLGLSGGIDVDGAATIDGATTINNSLTATSGTFNGAGTALSVTNNSSLGGLVGSGVAPQSAHSIYVTPKSSAMTGTTQYTVTLAGTVDTEATVGSYGLNVSQVVGHTIGTVYGAYIEAANAASGGTITNAFGLKVAGALGGTVTSNYGIYIEDIGLGTNRYPLYVNDTDNPSVMLGGIKFATAGAGSSTFNFHEIGNCGTVRVYFSGGGYSDSSSNIEACRYINSGGSVNLQGSLTISGCTSAPCTGNISYIDPSLASQNHVYNNSNYNGRCFTQVYSGLGLAASSTEYSFVNYNTDNIYIQQKDNTTGTVSAIAADTSFSANFQCSWYSDF